jgi:hypothetical protein
MTAAQHPFEEALADLIRVLDSQPFPYCLFGALALGSWGTPRTTLDVDVLIALEEADRRRLVTAVEGAGFAYDQKWAEANPVVREYHLRFQRGSIPVDLMLPRDSHDSEALSHRRRQMLGELTLWIISPEDFILHKLKAGRAQDFVDVLSVLHRQRGTLDNAYLSSRAQRLGVQEELTYCRSQASGAEGA